MYPVINKRETGINLRRIMDRRGITVKDVQKYLKLGSVQSIYHWLNGVSMPTLDNLYALSELFHLPIDALVCGNRPARVEQTVPLDTASLNTAQQNRRIYAYYVNLVGNRAA